MIPQYYLTVMTFICLNILLSLSIGILSGYAGQVSLGHAAFMGIGAYSTAILTKTFGYSVWFSVPVSTIICGIIGLGVGFLSLRLKDDFLAITTMGLNFIVVGILLYTPYFGRALGIGDIPTASLGGHTFNRFEYLCLCIFIVINIVLFAWWLQKTWVGLAWRGIREAENVAQVMGINVNNYKLIAFVISVAIAGLAGALYAHFLLFITPYDFGFPLSIQILTLAVFGGLGTIRGPVLGAIVLTVLPEYLRFIQDYRQLSYGLILVLVVLFQPQGVFGEKSFLLNIIKRHKRS